MANYTATKDFTGQMFGEGLNFKEGDAVEVKDPRVLTALLKYTLIKPAAKKAEKKEEEK